ncbi:ABC transporter ATP-binding protein [Pelagibacterium lacus]|uniref:ABC transporter ATP-binding protein n=1 Tax=Pelagibacterium lacus TaxID=2282655 RepID=A0A369W0E8_9HYPH|nr:ABC transporter ATP-binding protein [Pelagibacterium lacus]RDE08134.1 ABC transporter ATP-binding protein [Pelagibacterium lacus]
MSLDLKIDDLEVRAASGRVLLSVPRLSVAAGMCLGVKGPSGAGKSTFLFSLAGLGANSSGAIAWGGTDLMVLSPEARAKFRRHHIGMVFQDFLLFEELSAAANAALPGAYSRRARQAVIARKAGDVLDRLGIAHGGRTVESFSGGERQRVAIARALAADPEIVLADEPTASLDRKTADRLIEDLVRMVREEGKTLIAVSHDPAVYTRMDRVIEIVDGAIVSDEVRDG